ncbi:NADAR family protein [Paenibacillus lutrae]|uniref:DUF1768 domain-containing protein n=1 Tax=Paenibacillus lutrae TaxID=2078573 RepID=A0A7X3FMR0_9BACL|nr:NADAR family protein [Paenibacillus lutrae]MVP02566.1 DUF1768 domain-containing protein [Paenibacillus lutrae]
MTIKFYKVSDEYGCFSNFSPHGFIKDNRYWLTSEHYFQAQKFQDLDIQETIRLAESPMIAAKMGRNKNNPLRSDWESIKDDVMRSAVYSKFLNNEDIKAVLLSTREKEIIEDTTKDYYWGCGKDGSGKNMLGRILMEVREKLK